MMNKYVPEQLNKLAFATYNLTQVKDAIDNGDILEAAVTRCSEDLEIEVNLGIDIVGKLPFSELEYIINDRQPKAVTALSKVGKTIRFKVLSITKKGEKYECLLSRKQAQEECYNNFITKLKPGQVINAVPSHIEDYGVFCDIGNGIIALLPTNNISVAHLRNPKRDLRGVIKFKAVVKSIEDGRITLTHKELLGTWDENASKYKDGDTVPGVVREVKDYGVFVEITPNLVGLADPYPEVSERMRNIDSTPMIICERYGIDTDDIHTPSFLFITSALSEFGV